LINLDSGDVSGFEALLRWRHPERGMVSPAEFIPLAEEIGLITPLGEWVLRKACAEAMTWPAHVKVAVNLSPVQFKSRNLVQAVLTALAYSRLPATRLELEITESVLLGETEANLAVLHQLRGLGVHISMDDFGTGYSSLSYLRSFPFDKIKIDQSFVREIAERPDCMAIIRAVVGLGTSLGIATTAEGVETPEQLERLRAEGCTEVQGYLFSPPRRASDIAKLLTDQRAAIAGAA
jgi:EAL domain-containing protein (putative c-di-GMP-specific phosphodiesterase class I)